MDICNLDKCTGCLACINACGVNAIKVELDTIHGYYPVVSKEKCINCGQCKKICPVNSPVELNKTRYAYAARSKNSNEIKTASSGGLAYELSKYILSKGGAVYGAAIDGVHVKHIRVDSLSQLIKLSGSKYVQSYCGDVYQQIIQDLKNGNSVLFVGTGCQTAAVKKFVNPKYYRNLYLIDIVCHGTPSQATFKNHIKKCSKGKNINRIIFREGRRLILRLFSNGEEIYSRVFYKDEYYLAFELAINLRKCCYDCKYANSSRSGDITLGDYHNYNGSVIDSNSFMGVSQVLINTEKGKELFESIIQDVIYEQTDIANAIRNNPQLSMPSKKHFFQGAFVKSINSDVFEFIFTIIMKIEIIKYTLINNIGKTKIYKYLIKNR